MAAERESDRMDSHRVLGQPRTGLSVVRTILQLQQFVTEESHKVRTDRKVCNSVCFETPSVF